MEAGFTVEMLQSRPLLPEPFLAAPRILYAGKYTNLRVKNKVLVCEIRD
jgi:hypothetical protein